MKAKILVVDDEESLVVLMEDSLVMMGFDVVTAYDGVQALEKARLAKPDVILLDVRMPRKNGWETCAELKADPALKDVPVIFLSAFAQREDIEKGLRLGAEKYIAKPADPEEVLAAVREIIKRRDGK
jgi:DNA-binding response OmpR family regulator